MTIFSCFTDLAVLPTKQFAHTHAQHLVKMKESMNPCPDPAWSFVQHQTIEMARSCLQRSQEKRITVSYFCELASNLASLVAEVCACCHFDCCCCLWKCAFNPHFSLAFFDGFIFLTFPLRLLIRWCPALVFSSILVGINFSCVNPIKKPLLEITPLRQGI